ncbi:hypothetical protein [Chroococcidiopsis thermalis]|uniref:Uncharacterized protein n=1 Tax=Chroococcidiopsis thermalis (strain PCC 7203) TaxID=251229 RepID=K9U3Z1_CHRTP|nr:hypothetical protein [Chroococcidiopsis thermalis]AFY89343.1 hypothetical protein Chro_3934 [Chroococcidiopsis thermalis PCC 7203]
MRIYLYILAGITSALIGWNLGQFILTEQGFLQQFPSIVLFPCIAISLAIAFVFTEIFVSNPTRPKMNLKVAVLPVSIAAGLGLLAGLVAGGISEILFLPAIRVPTPIVRTLGWLLIGSSTGIAEGVTWRWRSIEAGDRKRFQQRFWTGLIGSIAASLAAALIFEMLRQSLPELMQAMKKVEDPIGFSILGTLLGFVFSVSTSPSYMAALRAGAGFEYTGEPIYDDSSDRNANAHPIIDKQSKLKFVTDSEADQIEEGLSIQLPAKGKIGIGSDEKAHIRIPGLPLHAAEIELQPRQTTLVPDPKFFHTVEVNGERLTSRRSIRLKHNFVLTFYLQDKGTDNEKKLFRFVYYNRFLDPQA